jgi:hypothetical protein
LDDYLTIPIPPYLYPHYVTGKSALVWAQDGAAQNNAPGGDWSCQKTRDLYYTALNSITDKERQQYFAMMFRGLGHQIHLIQDMAVPEHTRNDAHPEQSIAAIIGLGELFFEPWAASKGAFISQLAQNQVPPSVSLNTKIDNYVPITQLTDVNQYNGTNPSTGTDIGLSEYTNANFFSDDTIFAAERYSSGDRHYFPYPKKSDTDLQDYINQGKLPEIILAWDGVEDLGFWIAKKAGNEIEIEHFLKPTYHTLNLPINIPIYYRTFYRDEKCYEDYTKKLVPRAVGYSARLLDYFFRGKLEMSPSEDGEGYVIENKTEEDMDGTFELYYDATDNQRKQRWSGSFALGTLSSGNNKSDIITFTPPDDAKEPEKYILVFQGRLGKEDNAVVGAVVNLMPSSFVLITQTSLRLDVLGDGVNNASILVGGEILGVVSGGLGKINDETLKIENEGEGDLYINGQLITDKKWTYKSWFNVTGWPNRWEVTQKPNVVVKLRVTFEHEGKQYYLMPSGVGTIRYTQPAVMPMEIMLGNDVEVYHQCEDGYPCDELSFYYTFTGELEGVSFDVQYIPGADFYSDNFPSDRVICCYGNHICHGRKVPEYGWDQCYISIGGYCYPKDGDYELHILNNPTGSRWTQKYYEEYHGALNFGEWLIGPCNGDDDTLRPTECIVNDSRLVNCNVLGCDQDYKAISPSEYRAYYKIEGSSLESLFLEKGYPLIEREVNLIITGVDERVLWYNNLMQETGKQEGNIARHYHFNKIGVGYRVCR